MKLNRSELQSGIDNKLFEIAVDNFNFNDLEFSEEKIQIFVSSEAIDSDIRIKGKLLISFFSTCDRCLKQFRNLRSVPYEFVISNSDKVNRKQRLDVVVIPASADIIDLIPTFRELIYIEIPMKNICTETCQGLCPNCGINVNDEQCECNVNSGHRPMEELKKI
jgi:uncharacterized protein